MAELTGTTAEWWRSHGRPPSTFNEQNTGKKWQPIEVFIEAIGLYEQAEKGSGVMLAEQLALAIRAQYCSDVPDIDAAQMANRILKEASEAVVKLNCGQLSERNLVELAEIREELAQSLHAHKSGLEDLDRYIADRQSRREAYGTYILREGAAN